MALFPLGILSAAAGGATPFPTPDYELIATTVLGTATDSVTFSGLGDYSSVYKHLQIRAVARTTHAAGSDFLNIRLNGDNTLSNYARHLLVGNGSTVSSFASTGGSTITNLGIIGSAFDVANLYGAHVVDIVDAYASKNKTIRSIGGTSGEIDFNSVLYINTGTITSVLLQTFDSVSNFTVGSRFSIYGIRG
jgi:hypothetical protein